MQQSSSYFVVMGFVIFYLSEVTVNFWKFFDELKFNADVKYACVSCKALESINDVNDLNWIDDEKG